MVLLDTNVFIYLANDLLDRQVIRNVSIAYASVTKVEALGYSDLRAIELRLLTSFFNGSHQLALTDSMIEQAIVLRQTKRMGLGDSIIAATALEHKIELWTANTDDFKHIRGLKLINPLANQ